MHVDFETYSEAGRYFRSGKWHSVSKSPPHGLNAVGAPAYAEHPGTSILSLAYGHTLPDLAMWIPGCPDPSELFDYIRNGGIIRAINSPFEYWIWLKVCHERMGWPALPRNQTFDVTAQARTFGCPGNLRDMAKALRTATQKGADGTRLINKFSIPHQPSGKDPRLRILPESDPKDQCRLYSYNLDDVKAEIQVAEKCPSLSEFEHDVWMLDQEINDRGMQIDLEGLEKLRRLVADARAVLNPELQNLTCGVVQDSDKLDDIKKWMGLRCGRKFTSLDKDAIVALLENPLLPPDCRRVLTIRQQLGATSVRKLEAIVHRLTSDGRLHEILVYGGAERTLRWAGRGPQPQNLPGSGGTDDWSLDDVAVVLACKSYTEVKAAYKRPLKAIAGCLRGLFCAAPGHDLVSSDYSAIEAVCIAELAGEKWRQEVFRTHGLIYEMSAAKITGIPFEEILAHKERTGKDHPSRKSIGKVAELASAYGGWIGAWKNFGADKYFDTDREIRNKIIAWREASPAIPEFWGGQVRETHRGSWEFYYENFGLEGAVVQAIQTPGHVFAYRSISYQVRGDVLFCKLPSGRELAYHEPRLIPGIDNYSKMLIQKISYMGMNNDYKKGPKGWMRLSTYGGKLAENVTQAVARDLLAYGMLCVTEGGYPIVLHVHDEIISEIPKGFGSIAEFETLMSRVPWWAEGWPVKASGGWRGYRYRKG